MGDHAESAHLLGFFIVLAAAACADRPADEPADTTESGITTAARLADLRTDTRFFRRYGASPSVPVMSGSGLYSFYSDRMRTPAAVSVGARACILEQAAFATSIVCSDGTAAGTTTERYAYEQAPVVLGNSVYYATWGAGGDGQDVVRYDASTGARTVLVSLAKGSVVRDIVARDADLVLFVESTDAASRGIWTTDGTHAGTIHMVPNPAFVSRDERVLGRIGKDVFVAGRTATGGALFKTDGSALVAIP